MEWKTVIDSIKFINKIRCKSLVLTGGEPTEHADFLNIVKYICSNTPYLLQIIITSNGLYFEKSPEIVKELLDYDKRISIQITNDIRYYPIHLDGKNDIYKSNRVMFCNTVESMYPQGRALENKLPYDCLCSKCFNFISFMHQLKDKSIEATVKELEAHFKFCTPQIDADGTLKPGESSLCKAFGTIYDEDCILVRNILKFRCEQCDFINKKLPIQYQQLINIK